MSADLDSDLTMLETWLEMQRAVLEQTAYLSERIADRVAADGTGTALAVVQRRAGATDDTVMECWPRLTAEQRQTVMDEWLDRLDDCWNDPAGPRLAAALTRRLPEPVRLGDCLPKVLRQMAAHSPDAAPDWAKKGDI